MKSINKALDILEILIHNPESDLSLSEIVDITKLNKSTANRILSTLIQRGYVIQKEKRGKYTISTVFLTAVRHLEQGKRIKDLAAPFLYRLCRIINETFILTVLDSDNAYIVDAVGGTNILNIRVVVGSKLPLYGTIRPIVPCSSSLSVHFSSEPLWPQR